jgi:hypothetical protein
LLADLPIDTCDPLRCPRGVVLDHVSLIVGLRGLRWPAGYSWVAAVADDRRQYGRQIQEFEATPYCSQPT